MLKFLRRLATIEPVLFRAVITAIVLIATIWGADVSGPAGQIGSTFDLLYPLIVLVGAWWARSAVTPAATVVQVVTPDGTVVAGPASPLPDGTPIVVSSSLAS